MRTMKKLSDLMRERNIELSKAKELLCGGKVEDPNRQARKTLDQLVKKNY